MIAESVALEMGDIVRVEGSDDEWKVYWIYDDDQVELIHAKYFNKQYSGPVRADKLTLIRKGERT